MSDWLLNRVNHELLMPVNHQRVLHCLFTLTLLSGHAIEGGEDCQRDGFASRIVQ